MLTLFRINDPFRLLGVLLLLLAIRLPIIIGNFPAILPELHWMVLAESLSNGRQLYQDVWDFSGPLASGVYWTIYEVFGRSPLVLQLLAIALVFYQGAIFNWVLVQRDIFNEKTYIPALLYVIFMSLSFDFFTLSPVLMALTFLLLTAHKLFSLTDRKGADPEIFKMGLFLGIASMLYLPSVLFFIMVFLGLAFFRVTSARHLMLILFGFLLIVSGYTIYYLFTGSVSAFYQQYLLSLITYPQSIIHVELLEMAWLTIIPGILIFFGISRTLSERGFVNFQMNCQRLMLVWLIPAVLSLFFTPRLAPFQLIVLIPPVVFFVTHWLLLIRKRLVAELLFILSSLAVIFICYNSLFNYIPQIRKLDYEGLLVKASPIQEENQKVLVLGDAMEHFQQNYLVTPYLNWPLARRHFDHLDDYQNMSKVYDNISKDYPAIIIDEVQLATQLFDHFPILASKYKRSAKNEKLYYLVQVN